MRKRTLKKTKTMLAALTAAACQLPGVFAPESVTAQTPPTESTIRLQYDYYHDWQKSDERMKVETPGLWAEVPVGERDVISGAYQVDSVSGASPWYLSTVSGASGIGIDDRRKVGDLKWAHYFDSLSIAVGSSYSTEQDYRSRGYQLETVLWSEDKNTALAFGIGTHRDEITSSQDDELLEHRTTFDYVIGLSQILTPRAYVQSNLSFAVAEGYHTDPYKFFDNRPENRTVVNWLTRYRYFIEPIASALHVDYRLSADSWGISAHTVATALHLPVSDSWMVRPNFRYYSQSSAKFFSTEYPPENLNRQLSFDSRLSSFGSVVYGIKVIKQFAEKWSVDVSVHKMIQRSDYTWGGSGSPGIDTVYAVWWSVGVTKKFD